MKTLRAIGVSALLWILIFIEFSITMAGLRFSTTITFIIHYVFLIPAVIFCASIYYKTKDKLDGFVLGAIVIIVSILFDTIVTLPLFIIPQGGTYLEYFSNIYLLAGFLEVFLLFGIYRAIKKQQN